MIFLGRIHLAVGKSSSKHCILLKRNNCLFLIKIKKGSVNNVIYSVYGANRSVSGTSILDHLCYYGVDLKGNTEGSCKIIATPHLVEIADVDLEGNLVFSKYPNFSVLKMTSSSVSS